MYELRIPDDLLYYMFYAGVAVLSLIAGCYLLFRRGNAFAPDVTPPLRLRRCTAAFFFSMTLSHLWYLPVAFLTSDDAIRQVFWVGAMLDFMIVYSLAIAVMFAMLQDRRRPLWPAAAMVSPLVLGMAWSIANRSEALFSTLYLYMLILAIVLIIYMVCVMREYGRWLRDNYADLEHKELWQGFVILTIILLIFVIYAFESESPIIKYITQVNDVILTVYLLWRVETLSDLSISRSQTDPTEREPIIAENIAVNNEDDDSPLQVAYDKVKPLLQQHCVAPQLYLQNDLTLSQLAKAIGTNRLYLSQYFARQGLTYNAYINDLRINHFICLYREAVSNHQPFTAQQLANDSGYRSYSTFSLAFKQRMGQSVTAWMHEADN